MPDITMCNNAECPMRNDCWRFTAKPSAYQSFATFEFQDDCCFNFWQNDPNDPTRMGPQ